MAYSSNERISSRPHWARRAETRVVRATAAFFLRLGWHKRIEPFVGYGAEPETPTHTTPDPMRYEHAAGVVLPESTGWIRVLARVMISPKKRAALFRTSALGQAERQRTVRGWRSFFTVQAPEALVYINVGDTTYRVHADEGGYIDVVLPAQFSAGWHEVTITAGTAAKNDSDDAAIREAESASVGIRVIGPQATVGLVSDIDDTAIVTALPRPMLAAWNSFVLHEEARQPVPGMSELYRKLTRRYPDLPVFYLSTGAWNVVPAMLRFFTRYRFPQGPLFMTDWGPTNTGFFRSGRVHKQHALERLVTDFPTMKWLLSGDNGQHDPVIYREFAHQYPQHVQAIMIRQLSASEAVLAHGSPTTTHANQRAEERSHDESVTVTYVQGPDGYALSDQLVDSGVLSEGDRP
ncbi:App1 family protein [Timonella sp. A28]|uniref:App1 family protein n=1 Tax=Timonella sp. A28 TaxID=3442640 RepID=UPI003EC1281B